MFNFTFIHINIRSQLGRHAETITATTYPQDHVLHTNLLRLMPATATLYGQTV